MFFAFNHFLSKSVSSTILIIHIIEWRQKLCSSGVLTIMEASYVGEDLSEKVIPSLSRTNIISNLLCPWMVMERHATPERICHYFIELIR